MNKNIAADPRKESMGILLKNAKHEFALMLSDPKRADRFRATALQLVSDYRLKDCSPESIFDACKKAAMQDLDVDQNMGQAYVVPRNLKNGGKSAIFQIGYRGYIKLLAESGINIQAYPVFACDVFEHEITAHDGHPKIIPNYKERKEDDNDWVFKNLCFVVTYAKLADGSIASNVMPKTMIEKRRKSSDNQQINKKPSDTPLMMWKEWYAEQSMKTAIHFHSKRLPVGSRVSVAIAEEEKQLDYIDIKPSSDTIKKLG